MSKPKAGTVYLVGAGPGDPGLLTLRGAELLARADVVIHDALVNPALLRLTSKKSTVFDASQLSGESAQNQENIHRLLIEHAKAGRVVVRLKGGDPYIFGRGGEEAGELVRAGVRFEVVPGISAFSAVASHAGIPLTHRGLASAFTVVTGHEDPGKPGNPIDWNQVARLHGTKIILMAVERIASVTEALRAGGMSADTPAALIRWGTTGSQQTLDGTLGNIAERARTAGFQSPAVTVIGDVVSLRSQLNWFERRPLFGRRIAVPRTREHPGELAHRLSELGADVLEIPTGHTAAPARRETMVEAIAGLGEYDWVSFTSVNGVNAFFDALLAAFEDIRAIGNLRIAALGSATAARVRELHLRVDAQPTDPSGKALAKAIGAVESVENLRILLARAEGANPVLPGELTELGAIVDDVPVYRIVPETADLGGAAADLAANGADWIVFSSTSTVVNLHRSLDLQQLTQRHPGVKLASIGPETTKALKALGLSAAAEANPHTIDALLDRICRLEPARRVS